MIGGQAGPGALDLLGVQRDDELLDVLGARREVSLDDELVRLLVAWRDEVDDGLAALLPAPRQQPATVAPVAAATPDLLPAGEDEARPHRRRLTAAGTAAAVVLGGTLSLSGVAAAVTGDPFAPYRAVGHALSIGGDELPANAAEVAKLNKRLTRARAALAHGDVAGVQVAIDQLAAQLATADLTDKQRTAIEHRLAALRAAMARAAAAHGERGRSEDRATAAATPPAHEEGARPPGTGTGTDKAPAEPGGGAGTTKASTKDSPQQPTTKSPDRPDRVDTEPPPVDQTDATPDGSGGDSGGEDQSGTGDQSDAGDQSGSVGTVRGGGGSTTKARAGGTSAAKQGSVQLGQEWQAAASTLPDAARANGGSAARR